MYLKFRNTSVSGIRIVLVDLLPESMRRYDVAMPSKWGDGRTHELVQAKSADYNHINCILDQEEHAQWMNLRAISIRSRIYNGALVHAIPQIQL